MAEAAQSNAQRKKRRRWRIPFPRWKRPRWPRIQIDLNDPRQRRKFFLFLTLLTIAGILMLIGGYEAYHYTESIEFCGTTCHTVNPQYVRHQESLHANVECVKCHIGPGASFWVKSKIDGLREIYMVLTNTYHRPIPSPIEDLRPAREICEECHAPWSFNDNIIKHIRRYENNEENTPVQISLILKMGGWQESTGVTQGIHWHVTNEVYYIPADDQRQVILWVGVRQPDGSMKEYFSRDMLNIARTAFVEKAWEEGRVRLMDCIDCHNRAAHEIPQPQDVVDRAIAQGRISRDLPYIRAKAVELLTPLYETEKEGLQAIEGLRDFYRTNYPQVYETRRQEIEQAIREIQRLFRETQFPDMRLNWRTYPDNLGHHDPFLGCFRCHDGKHVQVDEAGNVKDAISVKCNLCHTVPIVAKGDELLVEAPVIVGPVPESHADFRWTIEHRSVTEDERQECYQCHGQGFCNNGACHNLSHPPDMVYTHAEEYRKRGGQVCYTCHQNVLCTRCHAGGIAGTQEPIQNPQGEGESR